MNDTAGPDGVVPSLLVLGSLPSFPAINMDVPAQRERMAALQSSREEMASISERLLVKEALHSKLPPFTRYLISPGDAVHVRR